ncbi:MAG: HD domain-containing protein [Deltaproteobacteria bacterium]|nr:HD domain-containing protein [Deltaproteobacteria bacterium]
MLESHIQVKRTQISCYRETELYIKNSAGDFVLYKSANRSIDADKYAQEDYPPLYLLDENKASAILELRTALNKNLAEMICSGSLPAAKVALCEIVQEVISDNPPTSDLSCFPETIDILYEGYCQASSILKDFVNIPYGGYSLVEHCANVVTLVLNYCLFYDFSEDETKKLSLGALLHDMGLSRIDKRIIETDRKLTDEEYRIHKTHAAIGHDLIKESGDIDVSIAKGVLEHHERLDGSGYPRGVAHISFAGRLLGLIDSFDSLSSSEKQHRRKQKSFAALLKIKDEVFLEGKFEKEIFKNFCLSLGKKTVF